MKNRENILEFYGIVRNITEQKRIEQTLRDLDRQTSDFFDNILHEIWTPLSLILSPIESAIQGEYGEYIDMRFLEKIHKNAIKLSKLINNILDFSRIEAGRMTMKLKEADIVKFPRRYIDTVYSAAKSKNIP